MADILKAMSISGGILLLVVVVVIVVCITAVNRGATAMDEDARRGGHHGQ